MLGNKHTIITIPLVIFRIMSPPEAGTEAKIRKFDMTVTVYKDIVGFYITMNKTHFVYTLDSTRQLSNIKPINKMNIVSELMAMLYYFDKF